MADENQEQEQVQAQEVEPAREPAADQREDEPAGENKDGGGLLMPILYALLAAAGAFTLVMIIGIVVTFFTRPAQPSESPSSEPAAQVSQTQPPQAPGGEGSDTDDIT